VWPFNVARISECRINSWGTLMSAPNSRKRSNAPSPFRPMTADVSVPCCGYPQVPPDRRSAGARARSHEIFDGLNAPKMKSMSPARRSEASISKGLSFVAICTSGLSAVSCAIASGRMCARPSGSATIIRPVKEYTRTASDMPTAGAIDFARNIHSVNSSSDMRENG